MPVMYYSRPNLPEGFRKIAGNITLNESRPGPRKTDITQKHGTPKPRDLTNAKPPIVLYQRTDGPTPSQIQTPTRLRVFIRFNGIAKSLLHGPYAFTLGMGGWVF